MSQYNQGTLYTGNIVKNINNEKILIKENTMLIYDGQKDCFYTVEVLNYLLDLETNKNLSEEKKEECQRKVNENRYHYCSNKNDCILYIDEESIKPFSPEEKKRK